MNPAVPVVVVLDMSAELKAGAGMSQLVGGRSDWYGMALRVIGAGCLLATAGIHLDLYLTGYRTIPTIGPLFLLQVITGFVLGLAVLVMRSRLVALAAGGFALATLGGYLLSVQFGLFGFREVETTAGIVAGVIEVVAFAALALYAMSPVSGTAAGSEGLSPGVGAAGGLGGSSSRDGTAGARAGRGIGMRVPLPRPLSLAQASLGVAGISVVAFGLLAGALAGAPSGASSGTSGTTASAGALSTTRIGGVTVLTNSQGRTLYWFAPDSPNHSTCYGSCAAVWPPVAGPVSGPHGVTGKFGAITRTDGTKQETYNGRPLYTYVGDSGPGQAHGNNLNLNGGLWHEVVVSG
jgi:predicted lipoprotein with Yx(FWY)xxD motif